LKQPLLLIVANSLAKTVDVSAKMMWIPRGQGSLNDMLDKRAFRTRVGFAGGSICYVTQSSELLLKRDVFGCNDAMLAQEITECQSTALLLTTRFHDVKVMCVWPFPWAMKEGAEGIIRMWNMKVAERGERCGVTLDG
jgi:hypothetical protein